MQVNNIVIDACNLKFMTVNLPVLINKCEGTFLCILLHGLWHLPPEKIILYVFC